MLSDVPTQRVLDLDAKIVRRQIASDLAQLALSLSKGCIRDVGNAVLEWPPCDVRCRRLRHARRGAAVGNGGTKHRKAGLLQLLRLRSAAGRFFNLGGLPASARRHDATKATTKAKRQQSAFGSTTRSCGHAVKNVTLCRACRVDAAIDGARLGDCRRLLDELAAELRKAWKNTNGLLSCASRSSWRVRSRDAERRQKRFGGTL